MVVDGGDEIISNLLSPFDILSKCCQNWNRGNPFVVFIVNTELKMICQAVMVDRCRRGHGHLLWACRVRLLMIDIHDTKTFVPLNHHDKPLNKVSLIGLED